MNYWVSHLPLEVWVDVYHYPGKSRKQLGEIADKLGRKFAEYLQFYLHEWGKRTLSTLNLEERRLPIIPRTPMPENIKFFNRIQIWHFDSSTLYFLRNINTLFTDVNLSFVHFYDMTKLRTILDHLSPMLHGIHSMAFMRRAIPLVQQYFAPKLAQIRELTIVFNFDKPDPATSQASINFCMNWLVSDERDPAEPRLLIVHICSAENYQQFCMVVRQQFRSAKSPRIFAIELINYGNNVHMANFHLENNLDEQLDGQVNEFGDFQIHRYPANFARTNLQELFNKTVEKRYGSGIELFSSMTIGPIDENAGNQVDDNAGRELEDQPSTSG